jgi:hypothetical protein
MHQIRFSAEFNEEFLKLQLRAEKGNGEAKYLLELLAKATSKLAENREAGKGAAYCHGEDVGTPCGDAAVSEEKRLQKQSYRTQHRSRQRAQKYGRHGGATWMGYRP